MADDQFTVLLVEDEPLIRLFMSELLEEAGFKVVEAANASEATIIVEAGLPVHVLLTDVDLPVGFDGFELAHRFHEARPEAAILLMSGRRWPAQGDLPPGAAFLEKPCPNEAIVAYVHSVAERVRRARRAAGPDLSLADGTGRVVPFPKTA